MAAALTFGELLDAAHELPLDEQSELAAILARRVSEARRQALLAQVAEAEREFDAGLGREIDPANYVAELLK